MRLRHLLPASLLLLLPASACVAQQQAPPRLPRRTSPPPATITKSGCPAAVPPVTSESVASAADYLILERNPEQRACDHDCPSYTVRIGGDGSVEWRGEAGVEVLGPAQAFIASSDARALLQRAADHNFWALCTSYRSPQTTHYYRTTLSIAGVSRRVEDIGDGAPSWLRDFDLDADRVGDTHRWRHGGPDVEVFAAEHLAIDAVTPKLGVTQLMKAAALHPPYDLVSGGELDRVLMLQTDVNARDSSGWTALMYAAQAGPAEAMSKLLAAGADPRAVTNAGETALFAAVVSVIEPTAKVQLLLAQNVDVNAADRHGVTPLMLASRYSVDGRVLQPLLRAGADPAKRDDKGRLAVDYLGTATDAVPQPPVRSRGYSAQPKP